MDAPAANARVMHSLAAPGIDLCEDTHRLMRLGHVHIQTIHGRISVLDAAIMETQQSVPKLTPKAKSYIAKNSLFNNAFLLKFFILQVQGTGIIFLISYLLL